MLKQLFGSRITLTDAAAAPPVPATQQADPQSPAVAAIASPAVTSAPPSQTPIDAPVSSPAPVVTATPVPELEMTAATASSSKSPTTMITTTAATTTTTTPAPPATAPPATEVQSAVLSPSSIATTASLEPVSVDPTQLASVLETIGSTPTITSERSRQQLRASFRPRPAGMLVRQPSKMRAPMPIDVRANKYHESYRARQSVVRIVRSREKSLAFDFLEDFYMQMRARQQAYVSLLLTPVSDGVFRIAWIVVFALHGVLGFHLTAVTALYVVIRTPTMDYMVRLLHMGDMKYSVIVTLSYGLLSLVCWYVMAKMVWYSIKAKRLAFGNEEKGNDDVDIGNVILTSNPMHDMSLPPPVQPSWRKSMARALALPPEIIEETDDIYEGNGTSRAPTLSPDQLRAASSPALTTTRSKSVTAMMKAKASRAAAALSRTATTPNAPVVTPAADQQPTPGTEQPSGTVAFCFPVSTLKIPLKLSNSIRLAFTVFEEQIIILGELLELFLHTAQAYKISRLIQSTFPSQAYALLITTHCITTIVLHQSDGTASSKRFVWIGRNVVLDFCWGLAIPFTIFVKHFASGWSTLWSLRYDDTSLSTEIMGWEQILITNLMDYLVKTLPLVDLLLNLGSIGSLLTRKKSMLVSDLVRAQQSDEAEREGMTIQRMREWKTPSGIFKRVVHVILLLWGSVIFLISLSATLYSYEDVIATNGCKLIMRPWIRSGLPCAVQDLKCDDRGFTGSQQEIGGMLETLDADVLTYLIVSNCEELSVPEALHRFQGLVGLQIYNSSIANWSSIEAGISDKKFERFSFVHLVRSNWTDFPSALTTTLPDQMSSLSIVESNLSALPPVVGTAWKTLETLHIERCNLLELPMALGNLTGLTELSLMGNNIATIPDGALSALRLNRINLAANPIDTLPDNFVNLTSTYTIVMERTELAKPPKWVSTNCTDFPFCFLLAEGTPLCRNTSREDTTLLSENRPMLMCDLSLADINDGNLGFFPLDDVIALRAAD